MIFIKTFSDFYMKSAEKFPGRNAENLPCQYTICNEKFDNIEMKLRSFARETTKYHSETREYGEYQEESSACMRSGRNSFGNLRKQIDI